MSGALLQLAALGSQDVYLTGNPEITLFKSSYKRYSHFSLETIQVSLEDSTPKFGTTNMAKITSSLGDLLTKAVLVVKLDKIEDTSVDWGYVNKLGHSLIKNITVSIGGTPIDSFNGEWLNIYDELFSNKSHQNNYNKMIGNTSKLKNLSKTHDEYELFIPLNFWFSRSSSSSFPLVCLKQEFDISIEFNTALECINYKGTIEPSNLPTIDSAYLLVDCVFLSSFEQEQFIKTDHNYLIEQLQLQEDNISTERDSTSLVFDKPCKVLIWNILLDKYYKRTEYLYWATDNDWNKGLQIFSKLIWLSTRINLNIDEQNFIIDLDDDFINIGDSIPAIKNGIPKLNTLASKVKAIFLFAEKNTSNTYQAKATIDNVVILESTLTFEDMSNTIEDLTKGSDDSDAQQIQENFLHINKISVIDKFNYGNFINRTDNPIIKSQLKLNGIKKFKEVDGNYFNYLNPFYYFVNTPADGINTYSFALNPVDLQPSGTINFTYLTTKELEIELGKNNQKNSSYFNNWFNSNNKNIKFQSYAINYTLLKVSFNKNIVGVEF
jgi:hypothetical protein